MRASPSVPKPSSGKSKEHTLHYVGICDCNMFVASLATSVNNFTSLTVCFMSPFWNLRICYGWINTDLVQLKPSLDSRETEVMPRSWPSGCRSGTGTIRRAEVDETVANGEEVEAEMHGYKNSKLPCYLDLQGLDKTTTATLCNVNGKPSLHVCGPRRLTRDQVSIDTLRLL